MTDQPELTGVLCVIVAGLIYGVCDYFWNGGRNGKLTRRESDMLVLQRSINEGVTIFIGSQKIRVSVVEFRRGGCRVRLGFEASKDVRILRDELLGNDGNELGGEG